MRRLARNIIDGDAHVHACWWSGWFAVWAIGLLSLVPGSARPHVIDSNQAEHAIAYVIAALALTLGSARPRSRVAVVPFLLAYATVLELLQDFVPGRGARLFDVLAGSMGALLGFCLAMMIVFFSVGWAKRRRRVSTRGKDAGFSVGWAKARSAEPTRGKDVSFASLSPPYTS